MQKLGQFKKKINIIPYNMEKYLSFSVQTIHKEWDYKKKMMVDKARFNLRFIDSFQFMPSSLSNLTENLKKSGIDKFKYTTQEFDSNTEAMTRKGVYPYSYMSSLKKFDVNPKKFNRKHFTNDLTRDEITEDDFKFFTEVCKKFNVKNMGEYHDLSLKSDVLLLADVFENFRKFSLQDYKLDPCHYFFAPGLSWGCLFKKDKD
jgi:hypothetical protein